MHALPLPTLPRSAFRLRPFHRAGTRLAPRPALTRCPTPMARSLPRALPQPPAVPLPVRTSIIVNAIGTQAMVADNFLRPPLMLSQSVVNFAGRVAGRRCGGPSRSPAAAARCRVQLAIDFRAGHVLAAFYLELEPRARRASLLRATHVRV